MLILAPPVVKSLYEILEVTFDPLTLCDLVAPLLKELSADAAYASYLPLLQRALLSRLLAQLAQVYTTMEITKLLDLVSPLRDSFEGAYGPAQVEAYLMSCARRGDLKIRVDHAEGSITFLDEAFTVSNASSSPVAGPSSSGSASFDKTVQPSVNELVRTRVSSIATCLHNALLMIEPPQPVSSTAQSERVATLLAAAQAERKALQVRRSIVARRRELLSELSVRKEKEEASRRAETLRREKDEEARKALEAVRRKEQERKMTELENARKEEARKLAMSLKEKGTLKVDLDVSHPLISLTCMDGPTSFSFFFLFSARPWRT